MTQKNDTPKLAELVWDDQGLPVSTTFDDVYFSKASGIQESRYVFIDGNHLTQRWQDLKEGQTFAIGETGFGTGLNFLVAWQHWKKTSTAQGCRLHFCSVEKHPLSRKDLQKALALWPELSQFSDALLQAYPPQPASGLHRLVFEGGSILLNLFFDDAAKGLEQLAPISDQGPNIEALRATHQIPQPHIDAWFLDGFAPSKNPEMWSPQLFNAIANLSNSNTTFATFTVAGIVKRGLVGVGFSHKKIPGFGHKREMLIGQHTLPKGQQELGISTDDLPNVTTKEATAHKRKKVYNEPAWHLSTRYLSTRANSDSTQTVQHCLVIGGGLAGCHTAFALAQKGIRVTLLEAENALAQHASGNKQGVVYSKLSPHPDYLSRFNLTAQIFADNFYKHYDFYQQCGQQCGVAHLAVNTRQRALYQQFSEIFKNEPNFAQWLNAQESERATGVSSQYDALYLPQTGWLDPALLCQHLVKHPLITVKYGKRVEELHYETSQAPAQWYAYLDEKAEKEQPRPYISADAVVIANAYQIQNFEQSKHIPNHKIRGQVSHMPANTYTTPLRSVLCGDGYIAPAKEGMHAFGATFTKADDHSELRPADHKENLKKLATLSPEFAPLATDTTSLEQGEELEGKVGWRCATPDYFPIVGPVANYEQMTGTYDELRRRAKKIIDKPGNYHPNLFCAIGFGSRGLCYAPLCAELLASIIGQEFLPISRELYRYLHPARFIIRDLMRNKI